MERKESSRHLAAILFTDIVGYTSMMQRDESQALAAVRKHHDFLEQLVPTYNGEIYQYYGDGSLSIFSSATQAVHCAYELQKKMLADPRVLLRTGIHIGEIYTEGGKIFGDGVNVASRIESIAQGGTVLFSRDVYEKIRNHTSFKIKPVGTFEFKNVDDPVTVFALSNPDIITPDKKITEGKLKEHKKKSPALLIASILGLIALVAIAIAFLKPTQGGNASEDWEVKKSVAVLPFKNLSQESEENFLGTGIAEDILAELSTIKDLKVIAPSSSLKYKDTNKDLMAIAEELDVTSLLDGTVQKHNSVLRVSVKLIKASDESVIWAKSFDGAFEDILNVQRNVAMAVSDQLKVSLNEQTKRRFEERVNVDPEAYVNYKKGQELLYRSSGAKEDLDRAREHFEMAIKEDSTFSQAWTGLADAWIETIFWHRTSDENALPQAREAAIKALLLDPESGECYGAMGALNLLERDLQSAEKNLKKSIELSPNYSFAYERLAWIAIFKGDVEKTFELYDKVIQLDPLSTRIKGSMGSTYYFTNRYEEGIAKMTDFLRIDPTDNFLLWALAYCYAGNGEYQKAIETLDKRTIGKSTNWIYGYCYSKLGKKEDAQRILKWHLDKKAAGGHVPDFMMSVQYAALGDIENALDYIEKSYEVEGENWFVLGFQIDPMLDPLRNQPRFKTLMKRLRTDYGLKI